MNEPIARHKVKSESAIDSTHLSPEISRATGSNDFTSSTENPSAPPSPSLSASISRSGSFESTSVDQDEWEGIPPLDRITVFDLLNNLALPQRLEDIQNAITAQKAKLQRHHENLKNSGGKAKERVVEEWRRRLPPPDEQLLKYRKSMRENVDRLGKRWNDTKSVTAREKTSFIAGVLNVFITGYLIGAAPHYMYIWYTAQLCYFMPIRYYTYQKSGYHYFLADLCYFANLLAMLSIWVFPQSKRLFISTYCLSYGNNAVAIAMWRNSMVFHSLDKVTSMFIHIMPPVTLHCLVHLIPAELQRERFPAIYAIKYSSVDDPEHYTLTQMMTWMTVPYALWQLSYHFLITVRRREKIAAGRPTSYTWLRKTYSKTWVGKMVLNLPDFLQEPVYMLIQYGYAEITMLPCPLWFWHRWLSASFLFTVFSWSVYNGATFYIDVFGKRFQNELEQLKKDVVKWQSSPPATPKAERSRTREGAKASSDSQVAEETPKENDFFEKGYPLPNGGDSTKGVTNQADVDSPRAETGQEGK
ncbi:MAG: hypothetical protein M1837_002724 [Sclerophora amabilis]|nr:MAG: hypothetical protein M1837_002724 [Sclerophora amabilis]